MLALAMVLVLSSLAFASGGSSAETELVINILPYSEVTAPESLELTISKPGVADRNGNDNPHKIKVAANMPVKVELGFDHNKWELPEGVYEKDLWGWDGDKDDWLISPNIITDNGNAFGGYAPIEPFVFSNPGRHEVEFWVEATVNKNKDWTRLPAGDGVIKGVILATVSALEL